MKFITQAFLFTYIIFPAICVILLTPTMILAIAKAQQTKAKILTEAFKVKTAAALARNSKVYQKRLAPSSIINHGYEAHKGRFPRDVPISANYWNHQQQDSIIGQRNNPPINSFDSSENSINHDEDEFDYFDVESDLNQPEFFPPRPFHEISPLFHETVPHHPSINDFSIFKSAEPEPDPHHHHHHGFSHIHTHSLSNGNSPQKVFPSTIINNGIFSQAEANSFGGQNSFPFENFQHQQLGSIFPQNSQANAFASTSNVLNGGQHHFGPHHSGIAQSSAFAQAGSGIFRSHNADSLNLPETEPTRIRRSLETGSSSDAPGDVMSELNFASGIVNDALKLNSMLNTNVDNENEAHHNIEPIFSPTKKTEEIREKTLDGISAITDVIKQGFRLKKQTPSDILKTLENLQKISNNETSVEESISVSSSERRNVETNTDITTIKSPFPNSLEHQNLKLKESVDSNATVLNNDEAAEKNNEDILGSSNPSLNEENSSIIISNNTNNEETLPLDGNLAAILQDATLGSPATTLSPQITNNTKSQNHSASLKENPMMPFEFLHNEMTSLVLYSVLLHGIKDANFKAENVTNLFPSLFALVKAFDQLEEEVNKLNDTEAKILVDFIAPYFVDSSEEEDNLDEKLDVVSSPNLLLVPYREDEKFKQWQENPEMIERKARGASTSA